MAKFFIERPIFAIVLSIFIVLAGVISAFSLPIAQYPPISPPTISVSANYSGANALVVEESVAQIIEEQVNGVEGMTSMQSTTDDNGSFSMSVKFDLSKDADIASVQTQNRVAQATPQLPQDVQQNGVTTQKVSGDIAMFFALYSPDHTYDMKFLKNYGSIYLVDEIKRIAGVGEVSEYGPEFGMRVWLRPDKMAQLGITPSDVSNAIKSQNVQAPTGTIGKQPSLPNQEFQYTASAKGRLEEPAQFANIIVRANSDGSFVRIKDIGSVELGGQSYDTSAMFNGGEAAAFAIKLTSDANALETIGNVKKVLEQASKTFPSDLKYKVVIDNTNFVVESLREVVKTFVEALLLVLLIVFLFLQSWRATLIPMLAIPVSLIGTFAAFTLLGFSINTLTLFAMVLAIGLVVDDAIVVVEAVEHHIRHSGLQPKDATKRAMSEVSGPVVAIAFVLACVFIPVAFIGGTVGVLYKQFALTIAVSMALSAVLALSLTPALCVLLLRPHNENAAQGALGRFFDRFNDWFDRTTKGYGNMVKTALRKARYVLLGLALVLATAGWMLVHLPSSFVPDEDQGYFVTTVTLPEAANLNRTAEVTKSLAEQIGKLPGVEDTLAVNGFDIMAGAMKPNAAMVFTGLKPWADREAVSLQVQAQIQKVMGLAAEMPEGVSRSFNAPSLPGVGSFGGFTMMLQDKGGGTIEDLDATTKKFVAAASKRPEIGVIYSTFRTDTPGFRFDVDREKAQKLGVPISDIFLALQTFLGGVQVNDFNRFGRTYKVMMQAEPGFRADVNDTRFLYVRSSSGAMVPLNTLVTPKAVNGPATVTRYNGYRAVQIGGSPAPGYSSGQALTALEEVAKQTLPSTYGYEWADQSREEKISGQRAPIVFGFAILFVFLCLAALYESWTVPFAVLFSVPVGVFGAFLFQYARGLENNVYMQIGLVMLIGLAAKNAILIVEFAKDRVDKGMMPALAALEAAKLRLRPILMTSLAFIIGCLPLALATGAGAGARNAMGNAVVGGMLMATVLGIFLIPVLYVVIENLKSRFSKKGKKRLAAQKRNLGL